MEINTETPDVLLPTNDWIFKRIFGDERNKLLLIDMLEAYIVLPKEEFEITLLDTHLKREAKDDKLGILDIKLKTKSGKILDIEIQVLPFAHMGKRISYYKSSLIAEQICSGDDYNKIQTVICVVITKHIMHKHIKGYINRFRFQTDEGELFEDMPEEIYTIELPKIPAEDDGSKSRLWSIFLSAETREEFEMVAEKSPRIREAVQELFILSKNEEVRAEYALRQKALMDYNTIMQDKYSEGKREGIEIGDKKGREGERRDMAISLIKDGFPIEQVVKHSKLDIETVKTLYTQI